MGQIYKGANYQVAKSEADQVDVRIIEALQAGRNFRVEAGAGSGKTYSLNKAIEWLQKNKWSAYRRKKQNVICITYTNAAVDVIAERLARDSFILPSTIHSFAWNAIRQYKGFLVDAVTKDSDFTVSEDDHSKVVEVAYTLGHRYKEQGIYYLYHNDVLKLFCRLLDNGKFRKIFANKYPVILVDEYQDSYKPIVERFVNYFIDGNEGPQFGFFGDAWQTIYQSNEACGMIEHGNIEVIKKSSNFRSAPRITDLLNKLRPDLPQKSAIDGFEGQVIVVTCDDYGGNRRIDRGFKGELPKEEFRRRLDGVKERIRNTISSDEELKILMITHRVLAVQQGYEQLFAILKDDLKDQEDFFLKFFMEVVEPVHAALENSNMQLLFDTLGISRYPITRKEEKSQWRRFAEDLKIARTKRAIDVVELAYDSRLLPIPPKVEEFYRLYQTKPETIYKGDSSIGDFLDLNYVQFVAAIEFLHPDSIFSTEHGVKGEEYDNVIFVIGRGWNQYQFEKYAPMITSQCDIPGEKQLSFERNRNLFYVCCSRPKKRLFFFVSIPVEEKFRDFLARLVGKENIYTYSQYISTKSSN